MQRGVCKDEAKGGQLLPTSYAHNQKPNTGK